MASSRTKKKASKRSASGRTGKKWSKHVNETSNALDLQQNIFKESDPKKIAQSLKRSAKRSHRRKGTPFQSAMSMLNFYINRGGENISASQKNILEEAKDELRKLFDKEKKE
jgi:hypothetical protein